MRSVTARAALLFYRNVFKHKGTHRLRVAICADGELACGAAQLSSNKAAMRIVAITAGNQTHIDAMAVWPLKLSFLRGVASIAKKSFLRFQQMIGLCGIVRRMAAQAAHPIL